MLLKLTRKTVQRLSSVDGILSGVKRWSHDLRRSHLGNGGHTALVEQVQELFMDHTDLFVVDAEGSALGKTLDGSQLI